MEERRGSRKVKGAAESEGRGMVSFSTSRYGLSERDGEGERRRDGERHGRSNEADVSLRGRRDGKRRKRGGKEGRCKMGDIRGYNI